jgi:hypothetical protein
MPAETMLLTTAVIAFFATFALVLAFADFTWEKKGA